MLTDDIKRKRGRPKKENPYNIRYEARIGKEEQAMLEHMLIESDRSKSELTRRMIQTYYHLYANKW